ncbi:ATP-binding protein [Mycobacterium sp. HUMS_1102779]
MESMRAVGYTLQTAVADIVDNSISAKAANVDIYFNSSMPDHLAIIDDGDGMSAADVQNAMRLAGRNPKAPRGETDLGRFGLGLKTASLSQCRTLTVVSSRDREVCGYTWSLDHLAEAGRWALIELSPDEIRALPRTVDLLSTEHGTMVLWRDLDYLVDALGTSSKSLDEALAATRDHLALVFHRYLNGEHGRPFSIRINGKEPEKIDPFLEDRRATQAGPVESFHVDGEIVSARPYTLPFISKLTEADRRRAGVTTTLRDSQGFYIYRQLRLVIWGTWFSIVPKDDTGRLARVKVDVPNTLDHLWALDIKKSAAVPPPAVKRELRRIVDRIIEPSRTAHRYRGRAATGDRITRVWTLIEDRDGFRYSINRDHPLIKAIGAEVDGTVASDIGRALQLIEENFPIYDAYNRIGGDKTPSTEQSDESELLPLAQRLWDLKRADGTTVDQFVSLFQYVEPFCLAKDPIGLLKRATD